ncbi:MAG: hypothetical protein ABGY96_06395 [bacterium]|nr:hypothetical protein [Gammaproteobacteria bacterium]HIL97829.1 hypothetical protein [Pseudomonadales bacterium]
MARLQVNDPKTNSMIFVNREGMNLGEFTRDELVGLMVEAKCELFRNGSVEDDSFRDAIRRLKSRKNLAGKFV